MVLPWPPLIKKNPWCFKIKMALEYYGFKNRYQVSSVLKDLNANKTRSFLPRISNLFIYCWFLSADWQCFQYWLMHRLCNIDPIGLQLDNWDIYCEISFLWRQHGDSSKIFLKLKESSIILWKATNWKNDQHCDQFDMTGYW